MPKGARGEGYLELDGETYAILFTNRAIAEAEQATGKTILQLVNAGASNGLGMREVSQLLTVGLTWARREGLGTARGNVAQDAWRLLDQLGFAACLEIVLTALADVIGFRSDKGATNPPE
jgi:hypothetical protein